MSISQQTFPGVYTSVKDNSFLTSVISRFRVGLVGVATKGPFDEVVNVRSLKEFRSNFGTSLSGHYLANAAAAVTDFTDGTYVVRVGHQYKRVATGASGGGVGSAAYRIYSAQAKLFSVGDYVRVSQGGKLTTTNVKIEDYIPSGDQANAVGLQLVDTGTEAVALSDTYTSAVLDANTQANAASNAEAMLYAYEYSTAIGAIGVVTGSKNQFNFTLDGEVLPTTISSITRSGAVATASTAADHGLEIGNMITITGAAESLFNGSDIEVVTTPTPTSFTYAVASTGATVATGTPKFTPLRAGDLIRVTQSGKVPTLEVKVKTVAADGTITLEPASVSETGYQSLPLQDNYTAGVVSKVKRRSDGSPVTHRIMQLIAATAGTWANSNGIDTGLMVKIGPGSGAGLKKMLVYENSALVESIDNLSSDPNSANYYVTRINGLSSYVAVPTDDQGSVTGVLSMPSGVEDEGTFVHPANTVNPWNLSVATAVNNAAFGYQVLEWDGSEYVTLYLGKGFNGASPTTEDVIGTINPDTDEGTGLKLFTNTDNVRVNVLCCPGVIDLVVQQELAIVARDTKSFAIADIPDSTDLNEPVINPKAAIDWHNGVGLYSTRSRIDSPNLALYFNWLKMVDPFTSTQIWVPPTVGILKIAAKSFDREKPWSAWAGESRGIVDDALAVRFPKISDTAKNGMYGNSNSVNPIILKHGRIVAFGDRTMQIAESKLSAAHSVILTNYIVNGMADIAQRFVFDPNDTELLQELDLAFTKLLESVKSERGVEDYRLQVDTKNNTAANRNRREVIVDVSFIPVDVAERIFINATVRESGAVLNSVS